MARFRLWAPDNFTVSLQGLEGVTEVVPSVALLDKQLFTLGLRRQKEESDFYAQRLSKLVILCNSALSF